MRRKRRALVHAMTSDSKPLPTLLHDPRALAPDDLRNEVQRTLSMLGEEDRETWCRRLLDGLAKAGVHIGATLFMLGTVVSRLDELTPSDMGKLLRYSRINTPKVIEALAGPLTELLVVKEEPPPPAVHSDCEASWSACCCGGDHEHSRIPDQPLPLLGHPPRTPIRPATDSDLL